jgi:DNA replication and repair protein RecF
MTQYVKSLFLQHFRNHEESRIGLGSGINLIFGQNGAGKTNMLEATHYACLGKSFLTSNDRYAVREGADHFSVTATFEQQDGIQQTSRLTFVPGQGKRLFINTAPLERLSDVLGRFPVVIHSPDDHVLTAGPPEERRRFVDSVLCQFKPLYTENLMRFRRAIKQRNAALQHVRYRGGAVSSIETWDHEVVKSGALVAAQRLRFATEFERYLRHAYEQLSVIPEAPSMTYAPGIKGAETDEEFVRAYEERMAAARPQEIESCRTIVGPHRDEFRLALDSRELRRYASQGQHRTFGMSLKLAQYRYLQERCDATPILLLDDAFAHLDPERRAAFANLFATENFGQTIMTAASQATLAPMLRERVGESLQLIEIADGRVVDYIK